MNDLDEIVQEFLVESHENLDQLDRDLVALEREPGSRLLISSVFRTIHTIKGTCGFLGFGRLEALAHAGESLLSRLREGALVLDRPTADGLLAMVDAVREMLARIEAVGTEGDVDHDQLIARLQALATPPPAGHEPPAGAAAGDRLGEALVDAGSAAERDVLLARLAQEVGDPRPLGEILVGQGAVDPADLEAALESQAERRGVADSNVRVDVGLLDSLMRLVGELVLTRNQIVAQAAAARDAGFLRSAMRLNLIAGELQDGVMKTRMQPVGTVWSKFPRLVRDLAAQCGKQVRLVLDGGATELDRSLVEAIRDPLTHLVRNAVDHGIEPPADRSAAGKPAEGTVSLRAFHEGGRVHIEVHDDGAGMDPRHLGATALRRGLVSAEALAAMSEREMLALTFAPGLSTAAAVTNVSGRGVGMDVVKTNIERAAGTVDVRSTLGAGTSVRITIPLTLAIMPALTVHCAGERYAIPQASVQELVRVAADEAADAVEYVAGAPLYRLRGSLLPLVQLCEVLGLAEAPRGGIVPAGRDSAYLVVLAAEDRRFGLVVDALLDTEEIVVKALARQLQSVRAFTGATILGDGRVALVLDVPALAERAGMLDGRRVSGGRPDAGAAAPVAPESESLLVVSAGADRRVAIPLSAVTRLEELDLDRIERVGRREVIQHRGGILPLARLGRLLGDPEPDATGPAPVVVCSIEGASVGLVVGRIHDVVAEAAARSELAGPATLAAAVLGQRVTELLDLRAALVAADPERRSPEQAPA